MKALLLITMLAPWLTGFCGPGIHKNVPIKWSFPCSGDENEVLENQKYYFRDGFEYWNNILNTKMFVESNKCNDGVTVYSTRTGKLFDYLDINKSLGVAHYEFCIGDNYFNSDNMYISILEDVIDNYNNFAVRHEIGHILGLAHNDFENCLLSSQSSEACDIEIKTVKEMYKEIFSGE